MGGETLLRGRRFRVVRGRVAAVRSLLMGQIAVSPVVFLRPSTHLHLVSGPIGGRGFVPTEASKEGNRAQALLDLGVDEVGAEK